MENKVTKRPRLFEIDCAKGLAIALVVIGHVVAREPPLENRWYEVLKNWIYFFHMPFFMFLSGYVMSYSYKQVQGRQGYIAYVKQKFLRLIPAFLVMAILILLGKIIASKFIKVDNMPPGLFRGIFDICFYPYLSSASSLWYVYVLFIFYLLFPFLAKLLSNPIPVLVVSFALYFTNPYLPKLFMMNQVAGCIIAKNNEPFYKLIDKFGLFILLLFLVLIFFHRSLHFPKLIIGCVSIPALMYLVRLPAVLHSPMLLSFGRYTFIIYLINTIAIGVIKGVGLKILPWDGINFLFYFPLLTLAGIYIPIFIKKYVLVKWPLLDKYTD
jgi:peptidoglycan/LPS O-acetylase OafA/YrhL